VGFLTLLHRRLRIVFLAGLAGTAALFLFVTIPPWLFAGLRLGSGSSFRFSLWSAGWDMMQDHPILGVGTGSSVFESHRAAYLEPSVNRILHKAIGGGAHNVFLTKGAEMGWVGLLLAVALFVLLAIRLPPAIRAYREGSWIHGVAAAGIFGLFLRSFFETGVTLEGGLLTDSLFFFLLAWVLFLSPEPPRPREAG
jgi:O-antigen ligase